jgi:hypothetical protein
MSFNLRKQSYSLSESADAAQIPESQFARKEEFKKQIFSRIPQEGDDYSDLSNYLKNMSANKEFVLFLYSAYEHMMLELGDKHGDSLRKAITGSGIPFND